MYKAKAYSAASANSPLASDTIPRRATTERDVQIVRETGQVGCEVPVLH